MSSRYRIHLILLSSALSLRPAPASCEELGRLFFTPAQRADLDQRRQHHRVGAANAETAITVNGRVTRSSGTGTVWVNGVADHRRSEPNDDAGQVMLENAEGRVRLKVGQTLDPARGIVHDGVADGMVRVP